MDFTKQPQRNVFIKFITGCLIKLAISGKEFNNFMRILQFRKLNVSPRPFSGGSKSILDVFIESLKTVDTYLKEKIPSNPGGFIGVAPDYADEWRLYRCRECEPPRPSAEQLAAQLAARRAYWSVGAEEFEQAAENLGRRVRPMTRERTALHEERLALINAQHRRAAAQVVAAGMDVEFGKRKLKRKLKR